MRNTSNKSKKHPKSPGPGPGGISQKGQQKLNSSNKNVGGNSPRCMDASVSSPGYDTLKFPMKQTYVGYQNMQKTSKKYKQHPK